MQVTRRQLIVAGAAAAILAATVLLDALIVTERERIRKLADEMAVAIGNGDVDGFFRHISPAYHDDELSLKDLRALAYRFAHRFQPEKLQVSGLRTNIMGRIALAQATVYTQLDSPRHSGYYQRSMWQMRLEKNDKGEWMVMAITPIFAAGQRIQGWAELMRRSAL